MIVPRQPQVLPDRIYLMKIDLDRSLPTAKQFLQVPTVKPVSEDEPIDSNLPRAGHCDEIDPDVAGYVKTVGGTSGESLSQSAHSPGKRHFPAVETLKTRSMVPQKP
jgi:hypothetical protein